MDHQNGLVMAGGCECELQDEDVEMETLSEDKRNNPCHLNTVDNLIEKTRRNAKNGKKALKIIQECEEFAKLYKEIVQNESYKKCDLNQIEEVFEQQINLLNENILERAKCAEIKRKQIAKKKLKKLKKTTNNHISQKSEEQAKEADVWLENKETDVDKNRTQNSEIDNNDVVKFELKDVADETTKNDKENDIEEKLNPDPDSLTVLEQSLNEKYKFSGNVFLQHVPCYKLDKLESVGIVHIPVCRECCTRRRNKINTNVYCRFYEFRRLQYMPDGQLLVAGFPNPYKDGKQEDINIWNPDNHTEPTAGYMDIQVCRLILLHVGDQFCYLWRQEAEALNLHENPNDIVAWKKAVQGIREICDVCDTTLFNYHWTCEKCGFSVCLDCVKDRKAKRSCSKVAAVSAGSDRGRDDFHWLLCVSNGSQHEMKGLMLTQIIVGDALNILGRKLHELRGLWQIPQSCDCLLSRMQFKSHKALSKVIKELINESELKQRTAASSLATEETKRMQEEMEKLHAKEIKFAERYGIKNYVPGRECHQSALMNDPISTAFDKFKHINMYRQGLGGLRRFIPPRTMTLTQSQLLSKNVPHEWLCDGKLLRLTNPMNPDNRILFQEVWKCGQPVMISEVARSLDLSLWRPEAFCRDFGDKPNDLINCLSGNLVPNQPMRNFWEGFQSMKKRLLDGNGKPMLLKLKDWPPGDDFAEILPTRYADLMKGLPMPEYTLRTGNLNLASCLPKMFVPPDLGPKMYNAYGSAQHPDKGTTNLHLDISDAVNIMVYVGIPTDFDAATQLSDTHAAISMGGCEHATRYRAQLKDVLPGALWHIFPARDADKIRDLLNRVTLEKGFRLEPDHDPIHDQNWYLDDKLRARLFREYGVEGYPIVQCLGDAVFIPAGAPHQVQNLHNCIKVAEDFVSPENITHCYHLTYEFRRLSHSHTNHEDKLQIKNIIYHAIKDCCTILTRALNERFDQMINAKYNSPDNFTDVLCELYNFDKSECTTLQQINDKLNQMFIDKYDETSENFFKRVNESKETVDKSDISMNSI